MSSPSTSRELKLGLVGFGRVVQSYYLPALQMMSGVRVTAVVDPLPEINRIAKKILPGAESFEDYRLMLDRCNLDGVLIATPPSAHFEIWKETTSLGIPTFVEKPLLLSSQISQMDDSSREPNIMIDFNRRFWPAYDRVRNLIKSGSLGAPVQMEFTLHLNLHGWGSVTNHRLDPGEGGVLHDLGCHAIDLATQIVGDEPISIEAISSTHVFPAFQLRLLFKNESSARCDLAYGNRMQEHLFIHGPKGTIRLREPNMALHVEQNGARINPAIALIRDALLIGYRGFRRSESMGRASIRNALTAFLDYLRTGDRCVPGYRDGYRNTLWIAAAERSAASDGKPVFVAPRSRQPSSRSQRDAGATN